MEQGSHPRSRYDNEFFATADSAADASADGVIAPLASELHPKSVLDVGCARGVWLSHWQRHGAAEILGLDGDYVDCRQLKIATSEFRAYDLSKPFSLSRQFDLVQSLEVAEHVPESSAEIFVDNLTNHGRIILFSAALPGQGGEHHVNEQPWEYWRRKFAARGYEVFDFIRPLILRSRAVTFCYRFNTFLYVHASAIDELPAAIRQTHVPQGLALADVLPLSMRLRLLIVRCLPSAAVNGIARLRYRLPRFGGAKYLNG